jgi:hypothetical protein
LSWTTGLRRSSILIPPSVPREFAESVHRARAVALPDQPSCHGMAIRRSVRQLFIFQIAGPNT